MPRASNAPQNDTGDQGRAGARRSGGSLLILLSLLAAIALALGVALHPLAVDDAFVTYRYAHNLATGRGFAYNGPTDSLGTSGQPVLSTTSPLYALILAAGSRIWPGALASEAAGPGLPALANALSAAAIWAGAAVLLLLGWREGTPWVGAVAAFLWIVQPLLWLSLGLETAAFLAFALAAVLAYQERRPYMTGALLALATGIRGDGLILAGVLALDYGLRTLSFRPGTKVPGYDVPGYARIPVREEQPAILRWDEAIRAAVVYLAVLLPLLAWLTAQFGSPLPATLRAKVAQAQLGITGFYEHTSYLQGLGILVRARLAQSPAYLLFVPALLVGLAVLVRSGRMDPLAGAQGRPVVRTSGWVRLLAAWGAAHLAGYTLLGVTPYYWYYAPLVPALVSVTALGIVESAQWLSEGRLSALDSRLLAALRKGRVAGLWAATLFLVLLYSDWAMIRALGGPVPPPADPTSKVLPEAKVSVYRQAGEWLRDHTPAEAVVGVTEVGVMGYYSGRTMVDFLGLLEPEVAEAIGRGDLYWALLRYQPDFLALTAVSPLYAYDLRADPWFQAAYTPVQSFDDARFWGTPLTIYQRRVPRYPLVGTLSDDLPADFLLGQAPDGKQGATALDADFGGEVRLLGAATAPNSVSPGDVLPITLYWEALRPVTQDYFVFVHLLGQHERVIAQRDAAPGLGARPTSQWVPGRVVADPYLLALPEAVYSPDQAVWEVGLYDARTGERLPVVGGTDNVRFGQVAIVPPGVPLALNFGPLILSGYEPDRLAMSPGETLYVTLTWAALSEGQNPAQATLQLVDEAGSVRSEATHQKLQAPGSDVFELSLEAGAPAGAYDLDLLVADPTTGQPWPLLGDDGQFRADRARLTKIRVYP